MNNRDKRGIKLYIDKTAIILLVLSFFSSARIYFLKCILFAMAHETAHFLCSFMLGYDISYIRILPIGCEMTISGQKGISSLPVYTAGPLMSFALAIILKGEDRYINLLMGIINLIPALPLDGGRIFYCICPDAEKLKRISRIFAVAMAACAYLCGYLWLLPFVFIIRRAIKRPPPDIFVSDLLKRLEKKKKII